MIQRLEHGLQEVRELGPRATAFRLLWELQTRTGLVRWLDSVGSRQSVPDLTLAPLRLFDARGLVDAVSEHLGADRLAGLKRTAEEALEGRVLCFGRWVGDYGSPVDWHRDPRSGERWRADLHWADAMRAGANGSDVKLTWEVARFPHAYHIARAAAFHPERAEHLATGLAAQIENFIGCNPRPLGVHWASGQEIAFRLLAWVFAWDAFGKQARAASFGSALTRALHEGAAHVARHIGYARHAVYNNHLLSEALLLYAAGLLLPTAPEAGRWRQEGRRTLEQQAERQFYADGGYIQHAHNYHRLALQDLLWAHLLARAAGEQPPAAWLGALERSLDFLVAHQCPETGRLPNYGANDGGLPAVLSTCDFGDFRPTLQAVSLAVRGERLYPPGPWDEEAAWWLGPTALDAPLKPPQRRSVSFSGSGYHVLRASDPATFCTLRCGSIRDRFSQIDMLHLDYWYRGENVLVDGGSYLYNGPAVWHQHFMRTASHNTVTVDGRDQMLHHRQFKCLYWTRARLIDFDDDASFALCAGEHYGYRRHAGRAVHRRSVLLDKTSGLVVVVDRIDGHGSHTARLHWLAGEHQADFDPRVACLTLATPRGAVSIQVLDGAGRPLAGDLCQGRQSPPRGWLSRYYGEKASVPSLATEQRGGLPLSFVTVVTPSPSPSQIEVSGEAWAIEHGGCGMRFRIVDGRIVGVAREPGN